MEPLEALGADVLLAPTIRIEPRPLDDGVAAVLRELPTYQLVVFTSANAVRVFAGYLARGTEDGGMPAGPVVAAVGPATAAALEKHGLACHLVPGRVRRRGPARRLEEQAAPVAGARVLIPCARDARDVLPETLRERGAVVDVLHIYDTVAAGELAVPAAQVEAADYITFTSASTAKRLAALLRGRGAAPAGRSPSGSPAPGCAPSARSPARRCASSACPWPWRPGSTRPRASSRRSKRTRGRDERRHHLRRLRGHLHDGDVRAGAQGPRLHPGVRRGLPALERLRVPLGGLAVRRRGSDLGRRGAAPLPRAHRRSRPELPRV